jgi:V/A-type H+-transporting ATPase subunit E
VNTESQKTSEGVQDLINRIRDDGVGLAKQEAEKILEKAKADAAKIVKEAKDKSKAMLEKAHVEIETERVASMEALKMSARDTVLNLKSNVTNRFKEFVNRLVTSATRDEELIKALVLVLAGESVDKFIKDKEIKILISDELMNDKDKSHTELRKRGYDTIMALSSDMLREGVELIPTDEISGGARVKLIKDKLEIDLTDKAIAESLYNRILPRFRAIIEGIEEESPESVELEQ